MRESRFVSIVALIAYFGFSFGTGNLFPFSTFPMFSDSTPDSGARLIALDGDGGAYEIKRFESWSCPELTYVDYVDCPDGGIGNPTGYLAKEAIDFINAHSGESTQARPVSLVVRVWRLSEETVALPIDCPVAQCTAVGP